MSPRVFLHSLACFQAANGLVILISLAIIASLFTAEGRGCAGSRGVTEGVVDCEAQRPQAQRNKRQQRTLGKTTKDNIGIVCDRIRDKAN